MIRYFQITVCLAFAFVALCQPAAAQFPKTLLIEEFTSATCGPCVDASTALNKVLDSVKSQKLGTAVTIRYHVNEPFPHDPMYDANPTDVAARKQLYIGTGSVNPPVLRINGEETSAAPTSFVDVFTAVKPYLTEKSPVKLDVVQTREGNQLMIKVTATASQSEGVNGLTLRLAVLESFVHYDKLDIAAWNKETDFYDVMRKMLANSSPITLNPKASASYTFTLPIDPSWNIDKIFSVAFLQDPFDNVVIQTGTGQMTSSVAAPASMAGFSLDQSTPNPANNMVTVGYSLGTPQQVTIELYNASGARVASVDKGVRESGAHRASIDISSLPAGAYTYTITAGKYRESKMMTVVK
jgi:hypothetical protein